MTASKNDLNFMKEAFPFWKNLNKNQCDLLKNSAVSLTYKKGQSIHEGSHDCLGLILVKSGQLRAYIISETGREITLYRLFERDICIMSASCMLKNISFDIYVEAQEDSSIIRIPTDVFNELNNSSLEVSNYTGQLISSRFSDVMWVMEQVLFTSFDKRLASFLLEQSAIDNSETINITHEEIAKHLGSAREVVTRMLKYFQNEDMVSLFRGGIKITDIEKMEKLIK